MPPATGEPEFSSQEFDGVIYRIVSQRVNTVAGELVLRLADGSDARQQWLRRLWLKVGLPNLLLAVAAFFAVNWAVRRALRPLIELKEAVERRSPRDLSALDAQGSPDEVYDQPATPFVLQFLGDVNLFHGRLGSEGDVTYVRPHELEVVAEADDDTWPVTLSQTLTVGPNTRIEFKREGPAGSDGGYVDVELPRSAYTALRQRVNLTPGAKLHLRPRRITRFDEGAGI